MTAAQSLARENLLRRAYNAICIAFDRNESPYTELRRINTEWRAYCRKYQIPISQRVCCCPTLGQNPYKQTKGK